MEISSRLSLVKDMASQFLSPREPFLSVMSEESFRVTPREIQPFKENNEDPYAKLNQKLQTENGAGRLLYNLGSIVSPSESGTAMNKVSRVLREHGAQAPVALIAEETGLSEEEIMDFGSMKNMFDVKSIGEDSPILTSEPLKAFLEEKKDILPTVEIVIFPGSEPSAD